MADDAELEEELTYPQEDVERMVQETAEEVLREAMWDELKVPGWIN